MMTQAFLPTSITALKLSTNQPAALRHFASEQPLFHEGDSAEHVYEIVSGSVKITKVTAGGREFVLDFFVAEDLLGLTQSGSFSYSAIALEPVTARCISRRRLEAELGSDPDSARRRLAMACSEIESLQAHLLHICLLDPRGRLAAFLCKLSARQGHKAELTMPMSQRDIAMHLGLTPETVCRVLRQFREAGWIKTLNSHRLTLINRAALLQLANDDAS
jgi:CRP/FNR family transcriptional regulator, anaerobic regulatory protein